MSETAWGGVVAIVLAIIGINWWSNRSNRKNKRGATAWNELRERLAVARKFYLESLQRELTNVILNEDLEAFEKAFYAMWEWQAQLEKADQSRRDAEYNLLLEKFPHLEDFDLIGTKHFIQYIESPSWSLDEAVERYKDISKFLTVDPESAAFHRKFSYERELEIFRERIQRYKDKRLKVAMEDAMGIMHGRRIAKGKKAFKDRDYEVVSLIGHPGRPFTPEVEYGIACKKLNEFGIYSFFDDDERNKTYYSFHRSDPSFSKNSVLMHF
jgi:hypothetical protein